MTATISGDGTSTLINLTTSGNTVLGDASTDTLNVGNGGLVKDASGNVGIGTASPTVKLQLKDGRAWFAPASENYAIKMSYNDATQGVWLGSPAANVMGFYDNNGSERARIDSSGNLLVGTTSTSYGARNVIQNNGTTTQPAIACINSTGSGTMRQIDFFTGSNTSRIGSIESTTSTTAFNTSSDYRLKNSVFPMKGALAKVSALNPVTYKWNIDGADGQGFIAHELQAVVPDCVSGEKDAVDAEGNPQYQGVDTSFLVATLTAALQELKALVDTQASTITALQADVEALKAQGITNG